MTYRLGSLSAASQMRENLGAISGGLLFMVAIFLFSNPVKAATAFALDPVTHKYGACWSRSTVNEAKQCALKICERARGQSCVVKGATDQGLFGAIAQGDKGAVGFSLGYQESEGKDLASKEALFSCVQSYGDIANCAAEDSRCQIQSHCHIRRVFEDAPKMAAPNVNVPENRVQVGNKSTPYSGGNVSGGYQTCNVPSDQIANRSGVERPLNPAYANVCISILPPTCRNWVMNRQPCAYRPCIVSQNLDRCPSGEPTSYIAKEAIHFTQADFAAADAQLAVAAKRIAAGRGNDISPGAAAATQYWQTQIMHRETEWANGGAGGVTYNGQ